MFDIVDSINGSSNQWLNVFLLVVALFRVYLEIIQFDFSALPITKGMFKESDQARSFHRNGFYMCLGYILLSAPFTLLS
jgi:hypothetical protein